MTDNTPAVPAPIVVGVDGSKSAQHALDWAGAEAVLRDVPLLIAHAGDVPRREDMTASTASQAGEEICAFGKELLEDALATVVEAYDHIEVSTVLRDEHPASLLVELSHDASIVVVGRSGHTPLSMSLLGSTSHRVAAHATCPVVVVDGAVPGNERIVVGVSPTSGGQRALRFAAAEAQRRGVVLHAVRSWTEAALTGAAMAAGYMNPYPLLAEAEGEILEEAVALVESEYPSVTVTKELTSSGAYQALPDAAEKSALLVIGRRRDEGNLPHLGSLDSWLAHHAPCPVVLVPTSG